MDGESPPPPFPSQLWSRATGQWWVSHDCSLRCHDDGWVRLAGAACCPFSFGTSQELTGTLWRSTCADVQLRPLAQPQRATEYARFSAFTF